MSRAQVYSVGGFTVVVPAAQAEGHIINIYKGLKPVFQRTRDGSFDYSPTVPDGKFDQMVVNFWLFQLATLVPRPDWGNSVTRLYSSLLEIWRSVRMAARNPRQVLAIIGLLALCVTAAAQARDPSVDCKAALVDTSSLYDWPTKQNVFFVESSGFIADRVFMAASAANGPSAPAKALASWLTIAEECPLQLTVAGKSDPKTLRVIKDAFELIGKVDLRDLDFTFVGSASAASNVEKLVNAVGGTFHTRPKLDD